MDRAIQPEEDAPVNFYFSYGSCMNSEDFLRTAPHAVRMGPAKLRGFRLAFSRYSANRQGGVADIVPDHGSVVEGILWLVTDAEMPSVDAREGVHDGKYRRIVVPLRFLGETVMAHTYEVKQKSQAEYPPSAHYANLLVTGAQSLSQTYQDWLSAHISKLYAQK